MIEEGEPQEAYHDENQSGNAREEEVVTNNANVNGNRPRIEPSGLVGSGEAWRDEPQGSLRLP
jgi:hypothetical protein